MIKIDKSTWRKVRISDVFDKIEENDKVNAQDRFDRFIKVEHMDAESLRIKRWSSQEAGEEINPTFYKIFRAGQVLFPTRNPHLRRAALAHFDGICGEKTLTLEPKKDLVNERYIPFLFHSEGFYAHSTAAIIGSTNPHCRWRDIANYEFPLPPKEQQAELAELLWSMDEVIEKNLAVLEKLGSLEKSLLQEIDDLIFGKDNSIGEFIDIKNGYAFSGSELSEEKTPFVVVTPGNFMIGGGFGSGKFKYFTGLSYDEKFRFSSGDMIVTMTDLSKEGDTLGYPALIPHVEGIVFLHNQRLGKIIINDDSLKPMFLYHVLRTNRYRKHILNAATKTTVRHTYPDRIKSFSFNKPNDEIQRLYIKQMSDSSTLLNSSSQKISASKVLQKSLINEIF